jgi:hypothetical protein
LQIKLSSVGGKICSTFKSLKLSNAYKNFLKTLVEQPNIVSFYDKNNLNKFVFIKSYRLMQYWGTYVCSRFENSVNSVM